MSPRTPPSKFVALGGCRGGLTPPAPLGRLVSSVVVGVSNDVPTLAYTVTSSDGVAAMPTEPLAAFIRRRPESSGFRVPKRAGRSGSSQLPQTQPTPPGTGNGRVRSDAVCRELR